MDLIGYIAAGCIGLTMGLVGGGGSILTIPVLVYLFHIEPLSATSYSFFIVGVSSLAGALLKLKDHEADSRMALLFGIPDIIGVIMMRTYIFPPIPGNLFSIGEHIVTKGELVMILFSVIMILSAYNLLKNRSHPEIMGQGGEKEKPMWVFMVLGLLTGLLTGMVGVGGGFLIIPVLVIYADMPIKKAIGTSLLIIACKSLIGFMADRIHYDIDFQLTLKLSVLTLIGLVAGNAWSHKIATKNIQRGFGILVLVCGIYMLIKETILLN